MSYRIAVGSSDGLQVDLKFGEVRSFLIYEVTQDKAELIETRNVPVTNQDQVEDNSNRCQGSADVKNKVDIISDCRCVVCKKIGFQAQKHLERKTISVFDIECEIQYALDKITAYYKG
jgi:predicted Fe-Mo cluster-binding NifX family protein